MPITYSIDPDKKLVLTRVTGDLTIALTTDYFERLMQDPDCPADAVEIVDFTDVTDFSIQYGDMKNITESYQQAKESKQLVATVFNCPSALSFGIGRMLQVLHEITNPRHIVAITRSEDQIAGCIGDLRSGKSRDRG